MTGRDPGARVDLVVVGAGIVGLAHAVAAVRRGLSVTVVEREDRVLGASVRNFGHGCVTAQTGAALAYGLAAREEWLRLGREADFWVGETGTVVAARAADELDVLRSLADERGHDGVTLLSAADTAERSGAAGVVGGAFLARDIRVDPRQAAPAIARWLATQPGATLRWSTHVLGVDEASGGVEVRTNRGSVVADRAVLCLGHDLDRLLPDLAEDRGVRRCRLHMLRLAAPPHLSSRAAARSAAVLSGLSMLRYSALAAQPAAAVVRERITRQRPDLLDLGVNLMFTQLPGGDLVIGDTHHDEHSETPFAEESVDEVLLDLVAELLGITSADIRSDVRQRWRGVYASAPGEFLLASPQPRTAVATVTSGIGMTTALGLGADVVDRLLAEEG